MQKISSITANYKLKNIFNEKNSLKNMTNLQKKALLTWRCEKITLNSLKKIKNYEIRCVYNPFVQLTILKKNIDLDYYREKFTKKTNKEWKNATINDIFKANLVWGLTQSQN